MELLKLYTAFVRRKWLVLQSVVFFTAVGVLLALLLPKNYTASARVLVSSSDSSLSILSELGLGEIASGLNSASDDLANRQQLATTRPVLDEVIWRLQLRDSDGRLYTSEELLVAGLTGEPLAQPNLKVSQQQSTDLLVFEARADDPELARLLADTAVLVAVEEAQDRSRADTREARLFIEQQLTIVQDEFDRAMADMAAAQADERIVDLETEMRAAVSRMSELMLGFEQNAAAIQEVRGRLAEQRQYQGAESVDQISPTTLMSNPAVQQLRERLVSLRQERESELQTKTARHPDVQRIDALIALVGAELEDALEEQHALDPSVQALELQLSGLIEKGAELQVSIEKTTVEFSTWPDKARRLSGLELVAGAAEAVFKSLQEQRYEIGVAEAMLVSDLLLVEPARMPDRHSSPKVLVNLILGFGVGICFGVGLALVFEYVDDSVKTPEDVVEVWAIPRLGVIPRWKGPGGVQLTDGLSPTDPVMESYRAVRTALRFANPDRALRRVGVTSGLPSEGKSTLSMNLAIGYARDGRRVLLVDLDLRRPTQHRAFSTLTNAVGVTSVLAGDVSLDEAVQETPVAGLSLLTSGPVPQDPGRLVESRRLAELLVAVGDAWDVVVVDTPPALVVSDALLLAPHLDGLIVVTESMSTSRRLLGDLAGRFAAAGVEPLGFVLNKLRFKAAGYGHYLKAYRAYESSAPEPPPRSPPSAGEGGA